MEMVERVQASINRVLHALDTIPAYASLIADDVRRIIAFAEDEQKADVAIQVGVWGQEVYRKSDTPGEMVDRVARALYKNYEEATDDRVIEVFDGDWSMHGEDAERARLIIVADMHAWARDAIASMHEPTADILNSGYAKVTSRLCELGDKAEMIALWQAMIDAALQASSNAG